MESIPILDLSAVSSNRMKEAQDLVKSMEEVGFVYLDNIPGYDKNVEAELLEASRWFFSITMEEKLNLAQKKYNSSSKNVYRGYIPINVSQNHLREQYGTNETLPDDSPEIQSGLMFYEHTPYPRPDQEDGRKFRSLIESMRKVFHSCGMEFLRLSALGLGLDENTFDARFASKGVSTLRLMHYPTYKEAQGNLDTFTCEEHIDGSFVTLLITFGSWGLEIERSDGSWLKVPPRPGSLVVNIGRLLSKLTAGKLKATKHRVRDIGTDRYSMPFFFEPHVDSLFKLPDEENLLRFGEYATEHMRRYPYQFGHVEDYRPICPDGIN